MCVCDPIEKGGYHQIDWIANIFKDCIYSPRDEVSFWVGMSSMFFWLFCQMPQFVANYKLKNADALSPYFLFIWLLGDTLNMVGCLMTAQLPTQLFTAVYFVFCDVFMFLQFCYYGWINHWQYNFKGKTDDGLAKEGQTSYGTRTNMVAAAFTLSLLGVRTLTTPWDSLPAGGQYAPFGRVLLQAEDICNKPIDNPWVENVGYAIGWASAVLYLCSRCPQIYKNYQRKSTDGLAIGLFISAVLGNLTYSASIFIRSMDPAVLMGQLPWIVGAVGTLALDATVFTQFKVYKVEDVDYEPIASDPEK